MPHSVIAAAQSEEIGVIFKKLFECSYFNVDLMRDVVSAVAYTCIHVLWHTRAYTCCGIHGNPAHHALFPQQQLDEGSSGMTVTCVAVQDVCCKATRQSCVGANAILLMHSSYCTCIAATTRWFACLAFQTSVCIFLPCSLAQRCAAPSR